MKTDDLENELRNLKLTHLTESELAAYCDKELDQIGRARVEAHLKQCFICERQFELLREENAALDDRVITAADVAFVERLMEQTGLAEPPVTAGPAEVARQGPWRQQLAAALAQLVADWQGAFATVRHHDQGEEVWRWQSADGHLRARAMMEKNADMIIHFSSNDIELEGTRLHFRLGALNQELTLRRTSESNVAARVALPWPYRQGKMMTDISIEII